jgi:hypothetical protein
MPAELMAFGEVRILLSLSDCQTIELAPSFGPPAADDPVRDSGARAAASSLDDCPGSEVRE